MAAPIQVLDENTIYLGDTYFPIAGNIKFTNITVTPNPTIFGSADKKGDTQVMSEVIQDTNVGGRGIYRNDVRTDTDRYWRSTCKTNVKEVLTLGDLTVDLVKPAALTTENLNLIWTYRNEVYFAFANHVYRWLEATLLWSALEYDLATVPTQAIVFNGVLYVAYGSGYATRDSAGAWTNFAGSAASYFIVWDTKLYRLGQVSGLWTLYSLPVGGAWSAAITTLPADVTPTGLVNYRDGSGNLVIYVVTSSGLWVYDATNTRFLQTEILFPPTVDPTVGTVYHDGNLYLTTGGLGMLSVSAGSQLVAKSVGLDLDDGVDSDQNGKIVALVPGYNEVLALVDATQSAISSYPDSGLGNPFEPHMWQQSAGLMTLWSYDGGWRTLWEEASTLPGTALHVSPAYGTLRVYWSAHGHAFYQALQSGTHNPRLITTVPAASASSHYTSWYSMGTQTQQKIHGHMLLRTRHCTATEKVEVYYGTDLDDTTWTKVATLTTDGQHVIPISDPTGMPFYYIRFRFDFTRGSNNLLRPIVDFFSSQWMRVLPATYAYSFDVNVTKPFRNKTPMQLLAALERLADQAQTPQLLQFSYQDQLTSETKTHYARIQRLAGMGYTGAEQRGKSVVTVSLVVPYQEDSLSGG